MKKMFKLTTITLTILMVLFLVTGCDLLKKKEVETKTTKEETKVEEKSKGKCKVLDCIKKISTDASYEEVNKIIGFEGESYLEGNGWKTYKWKLNDDDTVEVTFFSSSTTIKIDFDDELIKNKKVDFSKYSEIKSALSNNESVSYATMKEKFGGVDGTLVEKSSSGNKYRWVNSEGGYLNANFDKDNTKCSMVMGRI